MGRSQAAGFDTRAEVRVSGDRVLRGVYRGNGEMYRRILEVCREQGFFERGLIGTRLAAQQPPAGGDFDLVFEHDRVPFISYPHEWPAVMLRQAALCHLDLCLALGRHSILVKDLHPWNILFRGSEPVFVDFAALIAPAKLVEEEWLRPLDTGLPFPWRYFIAGHEQYLYQLYRRMFLPYFELPLRQYERGMFAGTRAALEANTMNAPPGPAAYRRDLHPLRRFRAAAEHQRIRLALVGRDPVGRRLYESLAAMVGGMDVETGEGGYVDYYREKGEDFPHLPSPEWGAKQRTVFEILERRRPSTVLDIGANTGWFSILAARRGCRVAALDVEEGCLQELWRRARAERLDILPLAVDIHSPTGALYAPGRSDAPLLISFEERFRCDLVLALAIIHHMALGRGEGFREIFDRLLPLTGGELVLEFVGLDDELIRREPEFFAAFAKDPRRFGWYTLENLLAEAENRFAEVEIHESHPASRAIVACRGRR